MWTKGVRLLSCVAITVALILAGARANAFTPPPRTGHVVDQSGRVAPVDLANLNADLHRIQETTGRQIAALVVPSLGGEPIEDVAYATGKAWRPGRAGYDDGVVLIVALSERRVRIEVGKGIEGALPDLKCSDIIARSIAPSLHAGDIAGGILLGSQAIVDALGPAGSSPTATPSPDSSPWPAITFLMVFCAAVAGFVVILRKRTTGGSWGSRRGWDQPSWLTSGPSYANDWDARTGPASSRPIYEGGSSGPSSTRSDNNDDAFGGGDFGGGGATGSF